MLGHMPIVVTSWWRQMGVDRDHQNIPPWLGLFISHTFDVITNDLWSDDDENICKQVVVIKTNMWGSNN